MAPTPPSLERFQQSLMRLDDPPVELDFSRDGVDGSALDALAPRLRSAVEAMRQLEDGAIANPDEGRQVGHYWLRAPGRAPDDAAQEEIRTTIERIEEFVDGVRSGRVLPPAGRFERVLLVGIGGSALGPMLVDHAVGEAAGADGLPLTVLDNTDPEGIDSAVARQGDLGCCLTLVISKSGGTPETRNGMLEVRAAYERAGLVFARHAVAITGAGSKLDGLAEREDWVARFPIPEWVGGRTSVLASVGLVPAALGGVDVRALLAGAAAMDDRTRQVDPAVNPAARLAATWFVSGAGKGDRNLVMLPYRDRLLLLSRYLQQLVMESLGKRTDRQGNTVLQGLSVFGNKGSTDQHAFVQQLRDGRNDFVAHFVRVLHDRRGTSIAVDDDGATSGDYLDGFWQGTRAALFEDGRASVTMTLEQVDERSLGALIALFERAVGIYAELIDINAYHQPGVEAGKKAAKVVLDVQTAVLAALSGEPRTAVDIAVAGGTDPETTWHVLRHLASNRDNVRMTGEPLPMSARFAAV